VPPVNTWSPDSYLQHAGFVPALGAGVLDLLDPKPGERILDLGCGEGTLTRDIGAKGSNVVGVDSSAAQIAAAKARGLDARVMNGEALTFDHEFDAVFSNAAMHWMKNPDAVIAGVQRALKRPGRFVAEFGGHGCVGAIHVAIRAVLARRGITMESPWYFPTAEEYGAKLEAHGFSISEIRLFPRPTPLQTGIEGWLDVFASPLLGQLPAGDRVTAVGEIADLLRPALCDPSGHWTADYVRLQFRAIISP
jgi:SAM-dependent methyltransferase